MRRAKLATQLTPYLFLIIPLLLFIFWVIGPMLYTFYLSLTKWDGISAPVFIGLRNYEKLFRDPVFIISLKNNLKWVIAFITVPVASGLGLAVAVNREIPGGRFIKAAIFAPLVFSMVATGLIWAWLYNPAYGLINQILNLIGLEQLAMGWLSDKDLVMWSIIFVAIWRQVGYVMVLYLAGLSGVDPTLLDASKVDGCNGWQTFRNVTFPLLSPITIIVVIVSVIDSLRAFDLVSVMTAGGPYNSSSVLANFMYIESFHNYKMGYGAAIAVILFIISLTFIIFYLTHILRNELEY